MKINIIILLIVLISAGIWTYWTERSNAPLFMHTPEKNIPIKTINGQKLDNIAFPLKNGDTVSFDDLKGKIVLVHFWATWCAPCLIEFPTLITLSKAMPDTLVVLAVSVDEKPQDIDRFIGTLKLDIPKTFLIISDPEKIIAQTQFDTIKLPETYIIEPNGTLYDKIIGASNNWDTPAMIAKLQSLITANK